MIYLVKAFDREVYARQAEVTGIDEALKLEKAWEDLGFDVTITMQCLKYIEVAKAAGNDCTVQAHTVYTAEEKLHAVLMVLDEGLSRGEVARRLDIPRQVVSRWTAEYLAKDDAA